MRFSDNSEIIASCTSEAQRVISSNRASVPDSIARKIGLLISASLAGPLGDEHRVVPRVADLLFRRAGGALHDLGGIAVDCRGEVLGQPALRRSRFTDQQAEPGR